MKIAIITGASSGLGREFVRQVERLYREHVLDEIWVVARRRERLEQLKSTARTEIRIFEGDLSEELVYQQIQNRLENQNPDIRMLINSAGFGKIGSVETLAKEAADMQLGMIDINCRALTKMTSLCLPYLNKGSRVINIASAAAFCPQPNFAVYAASKSYVLSFSRSLGTELKSSGISVTAVCPGPVETEFFDHTGRTISVVKKSIRVSPAAVVRKALIDAKNQRPVSVYSAMMNAARAACKILPHNLVLTILNRLA